jgi:hypothetical protein
MTSPAAPNGRARVRAAFLVAAAFVVGTAVGVAIGLSMGVPDASDDSAAPGRSIAASHAAAAESDPGRHETKVRVRAAGDDGSSVRNAPDEIPVLLLPPRNAGDPDVREVVLPEPPSGWADLEVQLFDAEGTPSDGENFRVIAIGAAWDPQTDDSEVLVHGETGSVGEPGVARVRVASPMRHLVQVDRGPWRLEREVVVPGTPRAVLRDAEYAEVSFELADDLQTGETAAVTMVPAEGTYAGPDGESLVAQPNETWGIQLTEGARTSVMEAPRGFRWRYQPQPGWVCDPESGSGPSTVKVRRGTHLELEITAHLRSADPLFAMDRRVETSFDAGAGREEAEFDLDAEDGDQESWNSFAIALPKPKGVLRWTGPDVEPGQAPYDLDESGALEVEVLHRPRSPADARSARVTLTSALPLPEGATVPCIVWDPRRAGGTDDASFPVGSQIRLPGEGAFLYATHRFDDQDEGLHVAGPVRLLPGSKLEPRLVRGGWLVVVPRAMPPADGGHVEIVRADGAPLLRADGDEDPHVEVRVAVTGGTVIGPLEPGPVVLDVLVGRVRWQRLEAMVRSGEHTALPIGPFGAKARPAAGTRK